MAIIVGFNILVGLLPVFNVIRKTPAKILSGNNSKLIMEEKMSKYEKIFINYIVICINEFAKSCNLLNKEAYIYLPDYKGIEFLKRKL